MVAEKYEVMRNNNKITYKQATMVENFGRNADKIDKIKEEVSTNFLKVQPNF